jgi:hypothetical protein
VRQLGPKVAEDQALAELRRRIHVAALGGSRELVDGVVVAAGGFVLRRERDRGVRPTGGRHSVAAPPLIVAVFGRREVYQRAETVA